MKAEKFVEILGAEFFAGVPDSQLKCLCNYLMDKYGLDPRHHIIGANEGNCAAIAAGYHLATGKIPAVYMQNSGEGNVINPLASLLDGKVYAIPVIFIVGWRGEPGIHDEPQHMRQGEITTGLLDLLGVKFFVIDKDTSDYDAEKAMSLFKRELNSGKDVAFVIRKNALTYEGRTVYTNGNIMRREDIIRRIVEYSGDDPVISTTGKTSRELFEIRESRGQEHKYDFLTVGSMGHSSGIALGVALNKPQAKVWLLDGDGALIMHMGAMAVIGAYSPKNMVHIVINNESHESVGGQPTVASEIDIAQTAKACGYSRNVRVENFTDLDIELKKAKEGNELTLIEVKCAIGARLNLGRPTSSPVENKTVFMDYLNTL